MLGLLASPGLPSQEHHGVCTVGLTLLNNLAQVVKALTGGAPATEATPMLVSAFSVSNCAGKAAQHFRAFASTP